MYTGDTVNKIEASGRIIYEASIKGRKYFILFAKVDGRDNQIKFYYDGDLSKFRHHTRVHVTGHVETITTTSRSGKDATLKQYVADSVVSENTLTNEYFGVKGDFFNPMGAKVFVKGKILDIAKENSDWTRYMIDLKEAGTPYISLNKRDRMPMLKVGDTICAVCHISTLKKERAGKASFIENIVIDDIAKCPQQSYTL